jgi:hypothetical protein
MFFVLPVLVFAFVLFVISIVRLFFVDREFRLCVYRYVFENQV